MGFRRGGAMTARTMTASIMAVAFVGLAGLLTACSDGGDSGGKAATTKLEITTKTGPEGALVTTKATLECGRADDDVQGTGFLADAAGPACATVRSGEIASVVQAKQDGMMCAEVYGGPQTAHITGTAQGKPVDLTVNRNDSCGSGWWSSLEPLLGAPERTGDIPA